MKYLIYDFTIKRYYYKKSERDWGWTCFKREATRFDRIDDARDVIKYYQTFSSNEFKVLAVKPVKVYTGGREYNYAL